MNVLMVNTMVKKIKNIFYVLCLLGVLMIPVSCNRDFLHLKDPNNMGEDDFWKTERDAILGLAGVFDAYQSNPLMGKKYREFDHLTDNATTSQDQGWRPIEMETHHAQTGQILNFWRHYYNVVMRANEVIYYLGIMPETGITETSRKRITAEAMFLKAYAYHDLLALWGDVPLYMNPVGAFDTPLGPEDRDDLVEYFAEELKANVIPNLPQSITESEKGRIPQGAAQALLGKLYLLIGDYENAADAFREV